MSDPVLKSGEHPSVSSDIHNEAISPQTSLRMRPKHFFSNNFDIDIVEDHAKADGDLNSDRPPNWLNRLIDINLLLLILLVGIPVLLYCIIASAN